MTLLRVDLCRCSTCVKDLVVAYDWTSCMLKVVNYFVQSEDSDQSVEEHCETGTWARFVSLFTPEIELYCCASISTEEQL